MSDQTSSQYLQMAFEAWSTGAELRKRRCRAKNYTYGKQWSDKVRMPDGTWVEEEQNALSATGRRPLTNNMIRQIVKCVIGNFRTSLAQEDESVLPLEVTERNSLVELDCRLLEEFLISGCAIQRVVTESRLGGSGVWIDNVSPENFFVNRFTDPRSIDIELVGMLHSMSMRELLMRFGGGDRVKMERLHRLYTDSSAPRSSISASAFADAGAGRCRVIELWTLESRNMLRCHDSERADYFLLPAGAAGRLDEVNIRRSEAGVPPVDTVMTTTMRWHCRFLTPAGYVIDEYDSPYSHGMHPFAVKYYPLIDGEVHSFVEDIIDQQRHINRLITLMDHVMASSAKGVLLFPIEQKPDTFTWGDIAARWATSDGIIPYRASAAGNEPRQIISSGEQSGAYHLLQLQMQLFQQISGVSEALQGHVEQKNMSAAMYEAQVQHSSVAILDLLDSFNSFRRHRNYLATHC